MTRPSESLSSQWLRRVAAHHAAEAASQMHAVDDDLALGCECADPTLQIERWFDQSHSERPRAG